MTGTTMASTKVRRNTKIAAMIGTTMENTRAGITRKTRTTATGIPNTTAFGRAGRTHMAATNT